MYIVDCQNDSITKSVSGALLCGIKNGLVTEYAIEFKP